MGLIEVGIGGWLRCCWSAVEFLRIIAPITDSCQCGYDYGPANPLIY